MSHPVECTIDLSAPGRQVRRLEIPKSTSGEGPTALVFGGNHGDEYEGQVAVLTALAGVARLAMANGVRRPSDLAA
jgi:predicted deacylase